MMPAGSLEAAAITHSASGVVQTWKMLKTAIREDLPFFFEMSTSDSRTPSK